MSLFRVRVFPTSLHIGLPCTWRSSFDIVYVVLNYDRCSVDSNDLSIGNEHTFSTIVVAKFDRVVNQAACKVCKLLLAYSSRATCSTLISSLETRVVYVTRYARTA